MLPAYWTAILSPCEDILLLQSLVSSILDGEVFRLFGHRCMILVFLTNDYEPTSPNWTCSSERGYRLVRLILVIVIATYMCCFIQMLVKVLRIADYYTVPTLFNLTTTASTEVFAYRQCKLLILRMHYHMVIRHILENLLYSTLSTITSAPGYLRVNFLTSISASVVLFCLSDCFHMVYL